MVYVMRALLAHLLVASLNRKLGFITKYVQCLGTRLAITYYASLPVWHARLSLIHPRGVTHTWGRESFDGVVIGLNWCQYTFLYHAYMHCHRN